MPEIPDFIDNISDDFEESLSDIISSNIIHDKYQFESKFDFDLKPHGQEKQKDYEIDVYFFIPRNIGINENTYSRDQFYTDLTNFLRIQTPDLFFWHKSPPDTWSLPSCDQYFAVHLITHQRQKLIGVVVQEVKLFGCFVDTELKKINALVIRILGRNKESFFRPTVVAALIKRLELIRQFIWVYRNKYVSSLRSQKLLADHEVQKALFLIDEYISYRLENVLLEVCMKMQEHDIAVPEIRDTVNTILSQESGYRKNANIIDLDSTSSEGVREMYHYRLGLLKKYVLEVLYLQSQNIKKEKLYRNLIAACGAALAATWAGLTDIPRLQLASGTGGQDVWMRLFALVFLGIIAYVFKDRIKELSREYFNQKVKCYLPDFDIRMFYQYCQEDNQIHKKFLGSCRELFRYLQREAVLPEILYIRDIGNRSALEPARDELILHYSKKVSFTIQHSHAEKGPLSKIHFIRDIARFDISEFLAKLDNPKKKISYFDQKRGIVTIDASKVYHINAVFRYACSYEKEPGKKILNLEFERIRIVLNKKGITRIETVVPRGGLNYTEI